MDLDISYGESIREARKEAGLSQKELATRSGLAEITIRQYETGKREPRAENLKKIADALNTSVTALLGKILINQMGGMLEKFETDGLYQCVETNDDDFYEEYIISLVKKLNNVGLNRICKHLEDLLKIPEYRKE